MIAPVFNIKVRAITLIAIEVYSNHPKSLLDWLLDDS